MAGVLSAPCCRFSCVLKIDAPHRPPTSRRSVVVRAAQVSRRGAAAGAAAVAATLLVNRPALAIFGFGENKDEVYEEDTASMLQAVREVVALEQEDPAKEVRIKEVRTQTNNWVATYRRDNYFAGRPSYSNTYSVLNALAGHYNSFGIDAPFPKKRLDQMLKEVTAAEKFLSRGR